jgi:hypothetical protein
LFWFARPLLSLATTHLSIVAGFTIRSVSLARALWFACLVLSASQASA